MDPNLERALDVRGRKRFYSLGKHPALLPYQKQLLQLLELGVTDDDERVVYLKDTIARFEEGESIAKQLYLYRVLR
jgi:hypothetical protein